MSYSDQNTNTTKITSDIVKAKELRTDIILKDLFTPGKLDTQEILKDHPRMTKRVGDTDKKNKNRSGKND